MTGWHWLSSEQMTVAVWVREDGTVGYAPPIVRKFVGQPFGHLIGWMAKQQGFLHRAY